MWLVWACDKYGVFVSVFHPLKSKLWNLLVVQLFMSMDDVYTNEIDLCAWGQRPSDWDPSRWMSTLPLLTSLKKRCFEAHSHTHSADWTEDSKGNKRAQEVGSLPIEMATMIARCVLDLLG